MNRALFGFWIGLCLVGGLALCGLVSPLASGYLLADETAGNITITRTTAPLVAVRYLRGDEHLVVPRSGRTLALWLERGRDTPARPCLPEPGRA